jgi:hypothetical protein
MIKRVFGRSLQYEEGKYASAYSGPFLLNRFRLDNCGSGYEFKSEAGALNSDGCCLFLVSIPDSPGERLDVARLGQVIKNSLAQTAER